MPNPAGRSASRDTGRPIPAGHHVHGTAFARCRAEVVERPEGAGRDGDGHRTVRIRRRQEKALAAQITKLWEGVDWNWYRNKQNALFWHWSPKFGWKMNFPVRGYNECLIMYVLAAASPTPVRSDRSEATSAPLDQGRHDAHRPLPHPRRPAPRPARPHAARSER